MFEDVSRNFSRYGIKTEWFREDLRAIQKPDLVLITSLMTYWYPGIQEVIRIIKENFSDTPVVLGGIYATLCQNHGTASSGADRVVTGSGEAKILSLVGTYTGFSTNPKFDPDDLNTYPYPALDLQNKISYIPLLTSKIGRASCRERV